MTFQPLRRKRGRPPRTEPPRSDLILAAALKAFARHGYKAANLRQIAAEARSDVSLISHLFGSKLDLWKAVIEDLAQTALRRLKPVEGDHLTDGERLRRAIEHMIDLSCDTPEISMFVVREAIQSDDRSEFVYQRLVKPVHDLVLPLVEAARKSGAIDNIDPDFFFFTFSGSIGMTVASRNFVTRFSEAAKDDALFRAELKRTLTANIRG